MARFSVQASNLFADTFKYLSVSKISHTIFSLTIMTLDEWWLAISSRKEQTAGNQMVGYGLLIYIYT
jgi:hypothetical protein